MSEIPEFTEAVATPKNTPKPWWLQEASLDDAIQHGLKSHEFEGLLKVLGRPLNLFCTLLGALLIQEYEGPPKEPPNGGRACYSRSR